MSTSNGTPRKDNFFTDPTLLIRIVAIYLFALVGTTITFVAAYDFLVKGELPLQLSNILVGILGASFTLIGYHSNTLAATLVRQMQDKDVVLQPNNKGDVTLPLTEEEKKDS